MYELQIRGSLEN